MEAGEGGEVGVQSKRERAVTRTHTLTGLGVQTLALVVQAEHRGGGLHISIQAIRAQHRSARAHKLHMSSVCQNSRDGKANVSFVPNYAKVPFTDVF